MKVLGADLAFKHAGCCMFEDGKYKWSSNYIVEKDENTDTARYDKFYHYFSNIIFNEKPDLVITELAYLGMNTRVYSLISELIGIVRAICIQNNIHFETVTTSKYRSFFKIKNKKEFATQFVKSNYPDVIIDKERDISDSILLARYGSEAILL